MQTCVSVASMTVRVLATAGERLSKREIVQYLAGKGIGFPDVLEYCVPAYIRAFLERSQMETAIFDLAAPELLEHRTWNLAQKPDQLD